MAEKLLESSAVSAFCSSTATMLAAGVQTDEAVHMLSENREQSHFKRVCDQVYAKLAEGLDLADSMYRIVTITFPKAKRVIGRFHIQKLACDAV